MKRGFAAIKKAKELLVIAYCLGLNPFVSSFREFNGVKVYWGKFFVEKFMKRGLAAPKMNK
jgi:hypothetical protein